MMDCIAPPPLDDQALNDALDGVASSDTEAHLARCAFCTERLEEARRFDTYLHQTFHRWDCPSTFDLSDYDLGLFTSDRRHSIGEHLAECPRCRGELAEIQAVVDDRTIVPVLTPTRGIERAPIALVARPYTPTRPALRGTASTLRMFQANDVMISVQPQSATADRVLLTGQVMDEAGIARWINGRVEVDQGEGIVAIGFVDDTGAFETGTFGHGTTTVTLVPVDGQPVAVEGLGL